VIQITFETTALNQGKPMSSFMHTNSVPVLKQMLNSMHTILGTVETHATAKKIEPSALLQARLYPDMFPLVRQVQIACDFSRGIGARLAGVEVPSFGDKQETFGELQELIRQSLAFIDSLPPAKFDGSESREIVLRPGTPKEKKLSGQAYLSNYGLPQFFFHVTTTYAILRHSGIEIGKKDFMGSY
jgi:hypothetical protein